MKRKNPKNKPEYDDCPICQAMKKAEEKGVDLSESELLEAFEKAKDKGGIVGMPPDFSSEKCN